MSDALFSNYIEDVVVSASLTISISTLVTQLSPIPSVSLSVGLSDQKVYYDKMADLIRMPFGVVCGVGRGMGILDWVVIIEEKVAVCG